LRHIYASTGFIVWCQENELAHSNTFLLADEGSSYGIVVDPGSEVRFVNEFMQESGISHVDVLITHGHFDHVFGVAEISRLFTTRVFMNPDDEIHLRRNNFYLKALGEKRSVSTFEFQPFPTHDELLKSVQVISAPGHTKGGVLFSIAECVFVGDLIMRRRVFSATVPGHNKEQWALTVRDIWPVISAHKHVFLGHGDFITPNGLLAENAELRLLLGP
jgi:glyoxylase-like metal-dependent hydrolase (beta-lactamase superfamily II)